MSARADTPVLDPARLRYRDDQPYSLDYGDIYHAADGPAEVRRMFLEPCRVDDLARQRAGASVRIGELGFGSGLNFVIAAEHCLAAGAGLHFVTCEASPIDAADFAAIAAHRARAHPLYAELLRVYPPRIRGWHQRTLADGRVRLLLWLGGARDALADLAGRQRQPLDAWFLDGFAPDRNPDLWEPEVLQGLGWLSGRGTRVATFTAAGRVRRGLEAAGFEMSRVDQRPHKRESLAGTFGGNGLQGFAPPGQVTVIGAGLAGASAAWQLARAGCEVTVLDAPRSATSRESPPASLMPATVAHARLLADGSASAGLRCHAYLHASALLPGLPGFEPTGALELAGDRARHDALAAVATLYGPSGAWLRLLTRDAAAELAGWPVAGGGLHLPGAGVVDIPALVDGLCRHPRIRLVRSRVTEWPRETPVVLACGPAVHDFAAARYLEVAAVQGQIDVVALDAPPRLPLVGAGYLVPAGAGLLAAGSTYEHRPWVPEEASRANLAQLAGRDYRWQYRVRGTRTVSSDRTAIAGPLHDVDGQPVAGAYVTTGHGSAGNVSAHLAAAVITAHVSGDCPPLARELEAALSPQRFRERQARRGYRHNAGE